MNPGRWAVTRRRLDIQGFERVDDGELAPVAGWLRFAFALCALLAAVGGGMLTAVAALVATTDICIPSLMYRVVAGFPPSR